MIILRQAAFSEDEEGMSTGKKLALGTLATAGTAALAFAGAKNGMLGNKAMMGANKTWAQAGKMVSNVHSGIGQGMMQSGLSGYNTGAKKATAAKLMEKSGGPMTKSIAKTAGAVADRATGQLKSSLGIR